MNERIKENWEKATGSAIPGPGFFASASDYNIEKFAELIMRECADRIDDLVICDDDGNQILDCDDVRTELLEHFGVEE